MSIVNDVNETKKKKGKICCFFISLSELLFVKNIVVFLSSSE